MPRPPLLTNSPKYDYIKTVVLLAKYSIDITSLTDTDGFKDARNLVEYEGSSDGSNVVVTIIGPGSVSYSLRQIAGMTRLEDAVFQRFAKSFGITPQLLQSIIIAEWLRIKSGG